MKKNMMKISIIFLMYIVFCGITIFFNSSDKTFVIENVPYLTGFTYYYPNDATGSSNCTGSNKCIDDFTVDSNGWYYYEYQGKNYLVVAAALEYCRDSSTHCGIDVSKHGIATKINYYNYYDTLELTISGKKYDAMVLDACGACMWGRQDTRGEELFDIFVQNKSAKIPTSGNSKYKGHLENDIEHFGTIYTGDIEQGWIYNRFDYKEIYNLDAPDYKVEKNINDVIDEIFNRAKSSYYVAYYTGSTIFGVTGGIPNTSSDLKGRYWYEFDINLYLGNTLFGQCVWYAKHRALEIIDTSNYDDETKQKLLASLKLTTGNGQDWFNNPDSSLFKKSANLADARPGSIVSWSRGQYGHVGIIENVYEKNGQTYVTLSDGYRSGGSSVTGWTISNTIEDAWAHSVVKSQDMTLDELKNYAGSFNGYVYLTS